uniref:Uncharacterized protein n=1 Tax=Anguilla anguilla TaxID=7936 RepID=A0A0E9Q916_ANGAN
MLMSQSPLVN